MCMDLTTKRRFGLTGTVMQSTRLPCVILNPCVIALTLPYSLVIDVCWTTPDNFVELWTLLNWAEPGCLGSLDHVREV